MADLLHGHNEWKSRPAHERFYDVADILPTLERRAKYERSGLFPMDQIKVESKDDIFLRLPGVNAPVKLNHWSFERFAYQIGANVAELRNYPANLVAPLLEYKLKNASGISKLASNNTDAVELDDNVASMFGDLAVQATDTQSRQLNVLMIPNHDSLIARSVDSASYGRYRDLDLAKDAQLAVDAGWRTPRARPVGQDERNRVATADDVMPCSIVKEGDQIGPAGVYLGDRNIFIFLVSNTEVLPGHFRFVTLENSEVGESRKLRATFGLMNYVCSNHILWGVSDVHRVERNHRRGSIATFKEDFKESLDLVTRSEGIPVALYNLAKSTMLGTSKDDVVDKLYKQFRGEPMMTKGVIQKALETAESNPSDADGAAPLSMWAFTQGATRYSQTVPYADKRVGIDRAVGTLLDSLKLEDAAVSVNVPMSNDDIIDTTNDAPKPAKKKIK